MWACLDLCEVGGGLVGAAQEAQEGGKGRDALHGSGCSEATWSTPLAQAHGEAGPLLQRLCADQRHEPLDAIQADSISLHPPTSKLVRLMQKSMGLFAAAFSRHEPLNAIQTDGNQPAPAHI